MNKKTVSSETGYIAPVLRTHIVHIEHAIMGTSDGWYDGEAGEGTYEE